MTTIAALAVDGRIVMGADTCTNVYDRPLAGAARKIRRIRGAWQGEILIAITGAGALADLLGDRLTFEKVPENDDDLQPWASGLARTCTDIARDAGLVDQGQMDGSVLLAAAGRLWTMSNHHAIPHLDGVAALGSGEGPAIGALDALRHTDRDLAGNLAHIVRAAVEIGIDRDKHSAGPIQLEVLAPAGELLAAAGEGT